MRFRRLSKAAMSCSCLMAAHELHPSIKEPTIFLTYNLVHIGLPSAVPGILEGDPRLVALQSTLKDWAHIVDNENEDFVADPMPGYLIYILEHQYTDDSLCFKGLKGEDRTRVNSLLGIARASGCQSFLASIEKREHGGCDGYGPEDHAPGEFHNLMDVDDKSTHLRSVVDITSGTTIVENTTIEEKGVVMRKTEDENLFDGQPVDEDFEGKSGRARGPKDSSTADTIVGWTGNGGASSMLWYRKSALMIMPGGGTLGYFLPAARDSTEFGVNLGSMLRYYGMLAESLDNLSSRELDYLVGLVCEGLQTLEGKKWESMWPTGTWPEHHPDSLNYAVAAGACLRAGWPDRFARVLGQKPQAPNEGLECEDFDEFLLLVGKYQIEQLKLG